MQYEYNFASDPAPVDLEDHYWLNGERLSRAFCLEVPPKVADLLDVAMAVYAADRRSLREFNKTGTGQRSIHIRLGLIEPKLWAYPEIYERLISLLSWMSEDIWSFEFVERQFEPSPAESSFLFRLPPERPAIVSLFSGGLDSLAGLAARAQQESDQSFVLVSGYTNNRLVHQQSKQVQSIRAAWRNDGPASGKVAEIVHIAVPFGIHKLNGQHEEKSQRARSLVFLTLGVAAALQADADTLWVYENGIGALNLPLNETQLGVDNYRGVHPLSLLRVQDLFELVLDRAIHIENPFLFDTKAEMCAALKPAGFANIIRDTVSCDGFPQRVANQHQCGYCTSCVLRRESLYAAGLRDYDPPNGYRYDLLSNKTELTLNQIYGPEVMLDQVDKLARCLSSDNPWQALAVSFPQLARVQADLVVHGGMDREEVRTKLVQMYQTYVREWEGFPLNLRLTA